MKRLVGVSLLFLAGCEGMPMATGGGSAFQEFLVIGSSMSFEDCRARGGLIIQDRGSPMVACDPNVIGPVVPPDEFDHPESQAAAAALAEQG